MNDQVLDTIATGFEEVLRTMMQMGRTISALHDRVVCLEREMGKLIEKGE